MSNITKLMLFLVVLISLMGLVFAQENKLEINSFIIYSDSGEDYQKNVKDGYTYNYFIDPGDKVEFEIELENTFDKDDKIDINDIEITVIFYNVTGEDNVTEVSSEFDLDPEELKSKTVRVKIPSTADELTKKAEINIKGTDDDNYVHEIDLVVYFDIEDEKHDVTTRVLRINDRTTNCNERSFEMVSLVSNEGVYDEDVILEVRNSELGLNQRHTDIDIEEDEGYTKNIVINLDENVKPGTYPIEIKTYYKVEHLDDIKIVDLVVGECEIETDVIDINEEEEEVVEEESEEELEAAPTEYTSKTEEKNTFINY